MPLAESNLVVAFGFFVLKFWEVVEAYEWYFVIVWIQVEEWGYLAMVETRKPYLL